MKNKIILLLLSGLLFTGCVSKPVDRFPDLAENRAAFKEVDMVLDVTILADIEGKKLGIDKAKHEKAIADTKLALIETFAEAEIKANFIHAGSGVFFIAEENQAYFYTEGFNGTDEEFVGYTIDNELGDEQHINFLRKVNDDAANFAPTLAEGETKVAPLIFSEIPAYFSALPTGRLMVIKVRTGEISTAKSIGVGLTTGLLTAVLSGGTYVATSSAVSNTEVNLSVINTQSGELIWQGLQVGGGAKTIPATVAAGATRFIGKE